MHGESRHLASTIAFFIGMSAGVAQAQDTIEFGAPVNNFRSAVTQAVLGSPRVNAEWYNFEASREAERGARGAYLPRVDLISEWGREERVAPNIGFDNEPYDRDATRLSVTQMLFDGFAARDEVRRLGFEKLSRYYQLKRASEEVALQAAEAYLEALKFQNLVEFAADNFRVHQEVYDKIAERAVGGVSQGVDLEQARARVALAESNLVTEQSNLYDVNSQFLRIVGAMPAEKLSIPEVSDELVPEGIDAALHLAYDSSPVINAAVENLRSTQEALNGTNSPFMPRLDLRYRNELEHDTDGFLGRYEEEAIEVVITYNLFRGGTDIARKREFYNLYNVAIEERKQACINVRQEVMVAYNDIKALESQVVILERNMLAQDKTRRAYRDQFDLGQRTLLDLLDSQNEYFDTQRAYTNAHSDLARAKSRTLAEMGLLLAALDVEGLNTEKIKQLNLDMSRDPNDENAQHLCPPVKMPPQVDREALRSSLAAAGENTAENDGQSGPDAAAVAAVAALAAGSDRYRKVEENVLEIELNVEFAFDSSVIAASYDEEIARVAVALRDNPSIVATVEGHTDNTGPPDYNQWLSERRANRVRDVMIDEHGVDPRQIAAIGFGEAQPITNNDSAEERQKNRRVELIVNGNGHAE